MKSEMIPGTDGLLARHADLADFLDSLPVQDSSEVTAGRKRFPSDFTDVLETRRIEPGPPGKRARTSRGDCDREPGPPGKEASSKQSQKTPPSPEEESVREVYEDITDSDEEGGSGDEESSSSSGPPLPRIHIVLGEGRGAKGEPVNRLLAVSHRTQRCVPMVSPIAYISAGCAGALLGKCLYVTGGWKFESATYRVDVCVGQPWERTADLLTGRHKHGMAARGRQVFVVGGVTQINCTATTRSVECLDTEQLKAGWREIGTLPVGVANPGVAVLHHLILVVGGESESEPADLVQVINTNTHACSMARARLPARMPYARFVGYKEGRWFLGKDGQVCQLALTEAFLRQNGLEDQDDNPDESRKGCEVAAASADHSDEAGGSGEGGAGYEGGEAATDEEALEVKSSCRLNPFKGRCNFGGFIKGDRLHVFGGSLGMYYMGQVSSAHAYRLTGARSASADYFDLPYAMGVWGMFGSSRNLAKNYVASYSERDS